VIAIAHGLLGGVFASAKINLAVFFSREFHRFKTGIFVRPVAKWLAG
jgi:hypothetical protein